MMIFGYHGGQRAARGTYWSPVDGRRVDLNASGGVLPGEEGMSYIRISAGWLVALAPLMGGLFVLAFPMIGLATVVGLYVIPAAGVAVLAFVMGARAFGKLYELVVKGLAFGWEPSRAFFTGKRRKIRKVK